MRHTRITAVIAVTAVLAIAACRPSTSVPAPKPISSQASPSSAATPTAALAKSPAESPTFVMPGSLCRSVDFTVFDDLTPTVQADNVLGPQGPVFASTLCRAALYGIHGGLYLFITLDVFTNEAQARTSYQGTKAATSDDYPDVHDVAGVGAAAYTFSHPAYGPTLVVHLGTVNLKISVTGHDKSDPIPADAGRRLSTMAKQIFAGLPRANVR